MADEGGICVCGDLASFEHLPVQVAEANVLWEQTEQVLLHVQGRCSILRAALGKSARLACEFWNLQQDFFDFRTRILRWQAMSKDLHDRSVAAATQDQHSPLLEWSRS